MKTNVVKQCDPKATKICIPQDSYPTKNKPSVTKRKMKVMKHESHKSLFKF